MSAYILNAINLKTEVSLDIADRMLNLPELSKLTMQQLNTMRQAGEEIQNCYRVLRNAGLNVVGEVLRDALNAGQTFYEFEHYPSDDVYDDHSHSQYYYHSHRDETGEHGHFHTFLRPKGMSVGLSPAAYYDTELWPKGDQALSHLIAIAMDQYGYPTGLFTVNRWVTDEAWYSADDVIHMLDNFVIDHAFPSWPVNRWITAMFVLYRPYIEYLLYERDEAILNWSKQYPHMNVFEDRNLNITSYLPISVNDLLISIDNVIASKTR